MSHMTEEAFAKLENKVRGGVVEHAGKGRGYSGHGDSQLLATPDAERQQDAKARKAGSNPAPAPQYRSKWEEQFAYELVLEQRTGGIRGWAYEDMTFKLAQGKYHRPDFLIWHLDGSIEIAQVKGHHKNLRASLTALKWAAQQRPWFRFTLKRRDGRCWLSEEVKP